MGRSSSHAWAGQLVILAAVISLAGFVRAGAEGRGQAAPAVVDAAPQASGPLTTSQIALTAEQEDALFTDENRYRYIVVRDSLSPRLDELRSEHPEAEVLLYKDLSFTAVDPACEFDPFQGAGLSECQARAHESWYLHGDDGERLTASDFPELAAMDVSSAGYRKAWLASVRARLGDALDDGSNVRYDGVWIDDANLHPGHGLEGRIAELSDEEYREETMEFVELVAPALRAEGFDVALNLAVDSAVAAERDGALRLARVASMINREQFVRFGDEPTLFTTDGDAPYWGSELKLMEAIQAEGSDYHAIVYGTLSDLEAQLYARASFLLGWNGRNGAALSYRTVDGTDTGSAWTASLGRPVSDRTRVGVGWVREFTGGTVLVNPGTHESQAFVLDRPHSGTGVPCGVAIELPPTSARMVFPC